MLSKYIMIVSERVRNSVEFSKAAFSQYEYLLSINSLYNAVF